MKKTLIATLIALIASPIIAGLPDPGMEIDLERTALVITDPQNDFLSPKGVVWGVVGESVTENKTVEHIEELLQAAKSADIPVFVSPHYYYPTDHGWKFEGALEALMHHVGMFDRKAALVNFRFMANTVKTTAEVTGAIERITTGGKTD